MPQGQLPTRTVLTPPNGRTKNLVRVIVVVEGINDIAFLRRISVILHRHDASLANLAEMETSGELLFVPTGGAAEAWGQRLAPLGMPEFHLLDREIPPETDLRRKMVVKINRRSGCRAVLTAKRSLENYLHPKAIYAASGIAIRFEGFDAVADHVARQVYHTKPVDTPWQSLPSRTHKRLAHRAKRWINTRAVEQMTPALLAASDPNGEVISWLRTIGMLANRV